MSAPALDPDPSGIPGALKAERRWFPVRVSWDAAAGRFDKRPLVKWGDPANLRTFDQVGSKYKSLSISPPLATY